MMGMINPESQSREKIEKFTKILPTLISIKAISQSITALLNPEASFRNTSNHRPHRHHRSSH